MKISISKKIMMMVMIPILVLCALVGVTCIFTLNNVITDEIAEQLSVSAYIFRDEYGTITDEELQESIEHFNKNNGIDVTIFEKDVRSFSTIDGVQGTTMDSSILNHITSGEDYFTTKASINGKVYFGYYAPVMIEESYSGAIFTGMSRKDANDVILKNVLKIVGYIIIGGTVMSLIVFVLVRKLVSGIYTLEESLNVLMENDLTAEHQQFEVEHDEIEEICNKTADFSKNLQSIISKIKTASVELKEVASDLKTATEFTTETSNEIAKAVEDVAHGAVAQAEETTNTTHRISDISSTLENIKDDANNLYKVTDSMQNTKDNAAGTLGSLQQITDTMFKDITATSNQVNITSESVQKIKEAISMIKAITSQTKLLALNASIEAAHAGEHGKGFAVVAENISLLANQSEESSTEIEDILNVLAENYSLIVKNVTATTDNMTIQSEKLQETQNEFIILEKDIDTTVKGIETINAMVEEITGEIKGMVDVISDLSAISEENSASTEETMASIQEMDATISQVFEKAQNVERSADTLMNEIAIFKVD